METKIRKLSSNGGIAYQEVFKHNDSTYRLNIVTESHVFQSYVKFEKWTEQNGFCTLIKLCPENDFNMCPTTYNSNWEPCFKALINDAKSRFIEEIDSIF